MKNEQESLRNLKEKFANNLKTDILRVAKTAFHFLGIVITHRNRDHNIFKAMQPRGSTFCDFTAAVEKKPTPWDLERWKYGLLGQFDVLHTQNIKVNFPWASKERFFKVLLLRSPIYGLKF
jgi:hypothetical protein